MVTASGSPVLIRGYKLALSIEGLRPKTVDAYIREVERLGESVEGRTLVSLTATDLREYFLARAEHVAPKTVHEAQLAIRRFYKFLVQEGEATHDPSRDVRLVRYRVDPQPTYSVAEVKRLVMVCSPRTSEGIRDRAMVLVLFDTGVRAGELVSMDTPVWERRQVQVRGKTGVRTVGAGRGFRRVRVNSAQGHCQMTTGPDDALLSAACARPVVLIGSVSGRETSSDG